MVLIQYADIDYDVIEQAVEVSQEKWDRAVARCEEYRAYSDTSYQTGCETEAAASILGVSSIDLYWDLIEDATLDDDGNIVLEKDRK